MKKAIIEKNENNGWYFAYCPDLNMYVACGVTEADCIKHFNDLNLPDYGLYKQINIRGEFK